MKTALITGITGQDGVYLSKLLLDKGYRVFGAYRRTSELNLDRHRLLGVENSIEFLPIDVLEYTNIQRTIERAMPDEVYNLAAQSFVALSFELPVFTADVTGTGALRVLEAVRTVNPKIRFYQASTSEMFGLASESPQNEGTRFHPRSPYAAAKLFAHNMTVNYRESYGMYACSGILFNHESPLRGPEFVTRKITQAVARIKLGMQNELRLGNLDARRDWGYAKEYVEAIYLMLQQDVPDDYIIATGENHSVREFAQAAFKHAGIDITFEGEGADEKAYDILTGKCVISIDPKFYRPADVLDLRGDAGKARNNFGWRPRISFIELVGLMLEHDLKEASKARH